MMDYQTFATRREARDWADRMRQYGWPRATVDRIETDDEHNREPIWIVCANHGESTCLYLRSDGSVR